MGYLMAMGICCGCGGTFMFNPDRVPSVGGRPICRQCIETVNAHRREKGIDEWTVDPDAYAAEEV